AQLAVADQPPPHAAHVGEQLLGLGHDHRRGQRLDGLDAELGAARDGEAEAVCGQPGVTGAQDHVGGRVVGVGVHGVRAVELPGGREAHVQGVEDGDLDPRPGRRRPAPPLTAPTRSPRETNRSSTIASAMTGRIMIWMSTDMYHHCGPRVAFWAATVSGMVWASALERNRASRYSFQEKTSTIRKVATRPGSDSGRVMERNTRNAEAPSTTAASSSSQGSLAKER